MNILKIHNNTVKPSLYEKGNSIMWTDEHISKQLLQIHLNKEVDLASRKIGTIKKTIDWILSNTDKKQLNILDLGCGPGLYSEILAQKGHNVTGVDFSANSIEYAKNEAKKKNLDINYVNKDYLQMELEDDSFDLIILIFTDFGPLLPEDRNKLLINVKKGLKPGGLFIFDVLNDNNLEHKLSPRNWETAEKGFWKNEPYIALSDSFIYEENKVILYQHLVIDEKKNLNIYRFWTHFFSHSDLAEILLEHKFNNLSFHEDKLPKDDFLSSNDVTLCKSVNIK